MPKKLKIIFILLFVIPLLALGWIIVNPIKSEGVLTEVTGIESNPTSMSLGDIPRLGGLVTKEFLIKNTSDKPMKLDRLTTSCMCTKAKIITNGKESAYFGMERPGDRNPPLNLELQPNEEAKIVFEFDPNAHGPKGVGPIERTLGLVLSEPSAINTLKFNANVIEK